MSLVLVMGLATTVLIGVFAYHQESTLHRTLGRGLVAEARAPGSTPIHPGTEWWWVDPAGVFRARSGRPSAPDAELAALAAEARLQGKPLLRPGALSDSIRFATPMGADGSIAVARLPVEVSYSLRAIPLLVVAILALGNLAIFSAFGAMLLRRRVVLPLQSLADGARDITVGEQGLRVEAIGPTETKALAHAFNEMTEALEGRTDELTKAVVDLRDANSELREARVELDRAERLAAVGTLAAGVAHEVGNPMGALLTFIELAAREPDPDAALRHLDRARGEGERVRRILRQLLDFSRPNRVVEVDLALNPIVDDARELALAQESGRGVEIVTRLASDLPRVRGDEGVIMQILLNLLLNGLDAVSTSEGPRLLLETSPCVLRQRQTDAGKAEAQRSVADGVECLVADNGAGVPDEMTEKIFDPFFTTKDPGEGTGLGLANAARMAEELGGTLALVAPPAGYRTAFTLRLPTAREGEDAKTRR
jgi:signal transduction histidine kinase